MRALLALLLLTSTVAFADDRWSNADPELRAWFQSLQMPDRPGVSCCGNADAYYADVYEVRDGKVFATVTDSRGNPVAVGTVVEIPPHKVNRDPNITPHTVLFMSPGMAVYCYILSSGV